MCRVLATTSWVTSTRFAESVCFTQSSLRVFLEELLPEDVHERCSGKAYVSPVPHGMHTAFSLQ